MNSVNVCEPPCFAIARLICREGYLLASCIGRQIREPEHHGIGILKPQHPIWREFLGVRWRTNVRNLHVATLWINNSFRGAKVDGPWILEVFGRCHIDEMVALANKMLSVGNGVDIIVKLERENIRHEPALLLDI